MIDLDKVAAQVRTDVPEANLLMTECFVCLIHDQLSIFVYDNGMVGISGVLFGKERQFARAVLDAVDAQRTDPSGSSDDGGREHHE
jgi:hypothetical protein